jgi:putative tryptophan/tyrosine transport system substrate-binding protein
VLANPASPGHAPLLRNFTVAAEELKLSMHVVELRRAEELDDAFAAMTRAGADALVVFAEPQLIMPLRGRIAALAATSRLPAMYATKVYVDAGGLMSYGPSPRDLSRRAAGYVDKILKGANPADLPVEQPTEFDLVLNLKAAKAIGLAIPPSVLFQAAEVIQ